jgi:hypothetical protein
MMLGLRIEGRREVCVCVREGVCDKSGLCVGFGEGWRRRYLARGDGNCMKALREAALIFVLGGGFLNTTILASRA